MSFIQRLNEITKPKISAVEVRLGGQTETVHFKSLTYEKRQKLIIARLKNGEFDQSGDGLFVAAEILAEALVDESGKTVATAEAIRGWDPGVVDALHTAWMDHQTPANEEDPSEGQS